MEFLRETELEKYMLNKLNEVVREYVETIYKPLKSRHRKTIMVFTGDNYKPVDIITRFVGDKRKQKVDEHTINLPIHEDAKREEEFDKEAKGWFKGIISQEDAIKELNPEENRIVTPFQDLVEKERLESYRRVVAGQIAVKLANVDNYSPDEVGRYAVETATMVVKHLREITI